MVVTPYIYEWQGTQPITLNHEVEHAVWISLDYLTAKENMTQQSPVILINDASSFLNWMQMRSKPAGRILKIQTSYS